MSNFISVKPGIHTSQEIFAIDMLTALKHDRKHVERLSQLYVKNPGAFSI